MSYLNNTYQNDAYHELQWERKYGIPQDNSFTCSIHLNQ